MPWEELEQAKIDLTIVRNTKVAFDKTFRKSFNRGLIVLVVIVIVIVRESSCGTGSTL